MSNKSNDNSPHSIIIKIDKTNKASAQKILEDTIKSTRKNAPSSRGTYIISPTNALKEAQKKSTKSLPIPKKSYKTIMHAILYIIDNNSIKNNIELYDRVMENMNVIRESVRRTFYTAEQSKFFRFVKVRGCYDLMAEGKRELESYEK